MSSIPLPDLLQTVGYGVSALIGAGATLLTKRSDHHVAQQNIGIAAEAAAAQHLTALATLVTTWENQALTLTQELAAARSHAQQCDEQIRGLQDKLATMQQQMAEQKREHDARLSDKHLQIETLQAQVAVLQAAGTTKTTTVATTITEPAGPTPATNGGG